MPRAIYEINALVWLREQKWFNPDKPDLSEIPDTQIAEWQKMGFDAVWFLGVWRKGKRTREICRSSPDLRRSFERILPDLKDEDIVGSPFSIADYSIDPALGNEDTLSRLREKLNRNGLRLILDFVPNHMAVDHPWTKTHPERFVRGTEVELNSEPANWFRPSENPEQVFAHGRDPYFAGWSDTVQVNVFSRAARAAMIEELTRISEVCDGVRCDMAMLVCNDVFRKTWGDLSIVDYPDGPPPEFWDEAIPAIKRKHHGFLFIAEVYWGLEKHLQDLHFDLTYDKTLYDAMRRGDGAAARGHLADSLDRHDRYLRFIENHDESRAAAAFDKRHMGAATLIASMPGTALYHEGQTTGRKVHLPVQLARRPDEKEDTALSNYYNQMLQTTCANIFARAQWRPLKVWEAWDGNENHKAIVTCWNHDDKTRILTVVNLSDTQAQAYTELPVNQCASNVVELRDLLSDTVYFRDCERATREGLYLDLAPGEAHVFRVGKAPAGTKPDRY